MSYGKASAVLALMGLVASSAPSSAMTGIGCPDLPEYARAVGTVENGEGSCGMTMAEARRILARGENGQAAAAPAAPAPRGHRKHHRRVVPQD